jgi:hypothetical protein
MTGQIPDLIEFNGLEYTLVGYKGRKLFSPLDYDMKPRMTSTACKRGYFVKYSCNNDILTVEKLEINVEEPKEINGVKGTKNIEELIRFQYSYENLNLEIPFSGKLHIATDFIDEMYVHMGFQRAFAFKKVFELQFKEGKLISTKDISSQMEKKRKKKKNEPSTKPEKKK